MTVLHAKDPVRYRVNNLCALFGVSKQAYYKYDCTCALRKSARESFALEYVRRVRMKDPGMGGNKLWHMYRREFDGNAPLGRDRFSDMISRNGLNIRHRLRRPRTTDSSHGLPTYPNIVGDLIPCRPDQLWVSDITYIPFWPDEHRYRFCYLSLVLDAYSEEIIGWSVGPTLSASYSIEALRMALRRIDGISAPDLIHHSDRGCQYASFEYVSLLSERHIRISMTESGDPRENAQAERVNGTMKNELLRGMRFTSIAQVREAVSSAVEFYNTERPHMSVGMMTPEQAGRCRGELEKRWTSYRMKAIKEKNGCADITGKSLPLPSVWRLPSGLRPPVNLQTE